MSTASVCAGCGAEIAPSNAHDRRRKWCSERCRKRTMYGGTCEDCGAPTNGSDGHGPRAPKVCARCVGKRAGERNRLRGLPRRELVERLWAEGKSAKDIAAEMGWTMQSPAAFISNLRSRGYDLPHRYPAERRARMAVGAAERMAKARGVARRNREKAAA